MRAFRVRTVAVLWYDVGMSENTNTAHRPAAPSPSAVAASMNAGRRKNANGRGNNSKGGGRTEVFKPVWQSVGVVVRLLRNDAVNAALAELDKYNREMSERYVE